MNLNIQGQSNLKSFLSTQKAIPNVLILIGPNFIGKRYISTEIVKLENTECNSDYYVFDCEIDKFVLSDFKNKIKDRPFYLSHNYYVILNIHCLSEDLQFRLLNIIRELEGPNKFILTSDLSLNQPEEIHLLPLSNEDLLLIQPNLDAFTLRFTQGLPGRLALLSEDLELQYSRFMAIFQGTPISDKFNALNYFLKDKKLFYSFLDLICKETQNSIVREKITLIKRNKNNVFTDIIIRNTLIWRNYD